MLASVTLSRKHSVSVSTTFMLLNLFQLNLKVGVLKGKKEEEVFWLRQ